jgi:glycosyltransferase involved in cell wall biosynthesis
MAEKKILFVINTLGRGGAEVAMFGLMKALSRAIPCEIHLYVMLGQGELIGRVPEGVRLLNRRYDARDVLSTGGRRALYGHILCKLFRRFSGLKNLPYIVSNYRAMRRNGTVIPKNLLWKAVSDGTPPIKETYDLAIAFLEGAATYYTVETVNARIKATFLHIDYVNAGYSRKLDHGCYSCFDRVCCVSDDVRKVFLSQYPELADSTKVFRNIIDPGEIIRRSREPEGFNDAFSDIRIISLGRLVKQKSYEIGIGAAKLLKQRGYNVRWYVFGEGEERHFLEEEIRRNGVEDSFFLMGPVDNPYPYLRQSQIYVQCSKYEGQSIAVREAKVLGLPVVLTRTSGNIDQITDKVDGLFVEPEPGSLARGIERLILDPALRQRLGTAAAAATQEHDDVGQLLELLER